MSAVYEPTWTLGTSSNLLSFNVTNSDPFFRLKNFITTRRQLKEFDIDIPESLGIADFESFIGKMYVVLDGVMYPKTAATYETGKQQLRKVSSIVVAQLDTNSDAGYVPLKFQGTVPQQINLKVEYVDLPGSTRNGLKQPFRMFCKIKYPVIFAQAATSFTIGNSSASISGNSYLPWVLPKVIGATTYSSNGAITNGGDLATYPSFVINGPINLPRITNTNTGEYIELNYNLATSGDNIVVNYDQDTLSVTKSGNSVLNTLTSGSTLFKIRPGTVNLTLTGSSVGSGAFASGSINSAWPLS